MQQVATGFGLIEGPVWDASGLYFSDVINGGVHLLDPRADKVSAGRAPSAAGIGRHGAPMRRGGIVGRWPRYNRLSLAPWPMAIHAPCCRSMPFFSRPATGFNNDLTTDQGPGRIYVGSRSPTGCSAAKRAESPAISM